MTSRSGRGPGGCSQGLRERGLGCLENLQAENQRLRTRPLVCQEGLPQPSHPTSAADMTGLAETTSTNVRDA